MKKILCLLWLSPGLFIGSAMAFEDVSFDDPYVDAIEYLQENGIVEGYENGRFFRPNQPITRSEFMKILLLTKYSQESIEQSSAEDNFPDIMENDWERPFVGFAKRKGIVKGYKDGRFGPRNNINAAEAYKIISTTHLSANMDDEKKGLHWAAGYRKRMKDGGFSGNIRFGKEITRGEMAQMIYQIREKIDLPRNNGNDGGDYDDGNDDKSDASGTVTIIELNDLHANLVSHAEQVRTGGETVIVENRGGLARIATKINQIKSENPNNILLNIGDTFHGGAEAMFTNGNAIVEPVNALGIDVGVPGNWDYAYGPVVTNARFGNLEKEEVLRPNYPNIAANVVYKMPEMAEGAPFMERMVENMFAFSSGDEFLPASIMLERGGLKIGVIGLTSDIVEKMHPMMAFNLNFSKGKSDYLELLDRESERLKSKGANLVVVASELGIHKDLELANSLSSGIVDIFFAAHTHEATFEKIISQSGAIVVEAGNDSYLGQMDITFDKGLPIYYNWTLHAIDESISEDPSIKAIVEAVRAPFLVENPDMEIPVVSIGSGGMMNSMMQVSTQKLNYSLDKVIGETHVPLERRNSLENNFNNVFTDLLRNYFGADIAITPGFRFDSSVIPTEENYHYDGHDHDHDHDHEISEYYWESENNHILDGRVTVADVYRFFPAPYHVGQGFISGENLKRLIEQNINAVFSTNIFDQEGGWVDGFSGIELIVDLAMPLGKRIISLLDSDTGEVIRDEEKLHAIGCTRPKDPDPEHTLCSYTLFEDVETITGENGENLAASDFLIQAIIDGKLSDGSLEVRKSITDQNQTILWPDLEFYQPLEGVK